MKIAFRIAVLSLPLVAACSTTRITSAWTAPAPRPDTPDKALVVAQMPSEPLRRIFEERLAAELTTNGVAAGVAAPAFPDPAEATQEKVFEAARAGGFDTIVLARFRAADTEVSVSPGPYGYPYYWGYPSWGTWGYVDTRHIAYIETSAFDVSDGRLLWTGLSESGDPSRGAGVLDVVAERVVERMQQDGVL